jgi:hypothetical protein
MDKKKPDIQFIIPDTHADGVSAKAHCFLPGLGADNLCIRMLPV